MSPIERRSILLVDDSAAELELMKHYLEPWQGVVQVKSASDGAEALQCLASGDLRPPCLIVIDNMMPVMGGIEAVGRMRERPELRSVPIVMWSGSSNPDDVRRAYESGVTSYLVKPTGAERTREALQLAVRYWLDLHIAHAAAM